MDPRLAAMPEQPDAPWLQARVDALTAASPPNGPASALVVDSAFSADLPRHRTALLLADWVCYPLPSDRVTPQRLERAITAFPLGFRSWWLNYPQLGWQPVGYSGWYPIAGDTLEGLEQGTIGLDRSVPVATDLEKGASVYLFNYSVLPPLRGTEVARQLVQSLAEEVGLMAPRAMAAITVSSDGARVAERFGMRPTGRGLYVR